ncbi:hypothetical protein [Caulobacter sp. NIBR1757]|uniref:hypothetical protein n=1 Tax=Caulobacter sp. NIBR1757 TaxID=3016000 RepID=UPI0022F02390|nr:hypothetical protein [Caulobacter sp. NIBR1757]
MRTSVLMRAVAVLAIGLAMSGCVMSRNRVYEPIREGLDAMKGKDVAVVYRTLGLPDRKETVGRKMMFVWNKTRCDVLVQTDLQGLVEESTLVGKPGACKWVRDAMVDYKAREAYRPS